jgi:signal transduction histidine kinase
MATILVVDDRAANREFLVTLLGYSGHTLLEACDGVEALELVRTKRPDLVITDILMPKMDGYQFVRELRADHDIANSRVVFYTAMYMEADARRLAAACGVTNIIVKPSEPQEVLRIVAEELEITAPALMPSEEFDRAHLRLLTDTLYHKVEELEVLNTELEHRVCERTRELAAANSELEAFSYSVSHDLRTPLRAISGFSQILLKDYALQLEPTAQRYLQLVCENAQRMGALIDDLLHFSHLGRKAISVAQIDMTSLVQEVINQLRAESDAKPAQFVLQPMPPAHGDRSLLLQVWTNLLSNALKFASRNEHPVIEAGAYNENPGKVYYVKDNGVGFDMRYYEKLFGVFQRLHKVEQFPGTGVGLAIVQRIVMRHGGRVWAEGKVNQGATFYFKLPEREHERS